MIPKLLWLLSAVLFVAAFWVPRLAYLAFAAFTLAFSWNAITS